MNIEYVMLAMLIAICAVLISYGLGTTNPVYAAIGSGVIFFLGGGPLGLLIVALWPERKKATTARTDGSDG